MANVDTQLRCVMCNAKRPRGAAPRPGTLRQTKPRNRKQTDNAQAKKMLLNKVDKTNVTLSNDGHKSIDTTRDEWHEATDPLQKVTCWVCDQTFGSIRNPHSLLQNMNSKTLPVQKYVTPPRSNIIHDR